MPCKPNLTFPFPNPEFQNFRIPLIIVMYIDYHTHFNCLLLDSSKVKYQYQLFLCVKVTLLITVNCLLLDYSKVKYHSKTLPFLHKLLLNYSNHFKWRSSKSVHLLRNGNVPTIDGKGLTSFKTGFILSRHLWQRTHKIWEVICLVINVLLQCLSLYVCSFRLFPISFLEICLLWSSFIGILDTN